MILGTDIETTGLDYKLGHVILEVSFQLLTDDLKELEKAHLVLSATPEELSKMNAFVEDMHTKNGLLDDVEELGIPLEEASSYLHDMFEAWTLQYGKDELKNTPLMGNSVHFDRKFLEHFFPSLIQRISHRNIDVSSISECQRRWGPECDVILPESDHRSSADLCRSLTTLKAFKDQIFDRQECKEEE